MTLHKKVDITNDVITDALHSRNMDPGIIDDFKNLPKIFDSNVKLNTIRKQWENHFSPQPSISNLVDKIDFYIRNYIDGNKIMLRIYRPNMLLEGSKLPLLLWIHGGGFFLGNLDADDPICETISLQVNCLVVSVDYRLCPEHPFPAGFNDCYSALKWIYGNAQKEFAADTTHIAVGGSSAGSCLAAGISLYSRDFDEFSISFLAMLIPLIDNRSLADVSNLIFDEREWNAGISKTAWSCYLSKAEKCFLTYAIPGLSKDLSMLPPTYMALAEYDLLRDQGIEFSRRLMSAGVSTELHVYPRTYHGSYAISPEAETSKAFFKDFTSALRVNFGKNKSYI